MTLLSQFSPYSFPLMGLVRLPEIKIPVEDKVALGLKPKSSNALYMKHLVWQGYLTRRDAGRFVGFTEEQVKERLQTEFAVFEKTGTHDYFLLLWDINKWCDAQGILRGCGRGSSGGSLAMFCLGITDINPLTHGLYFARFLSEARTKPKTIDGILYVEGKTAPDVDGDYEYVRRPEVLKYIENKYQGRTCKISTRLQLTGKTALKDVLKAYLEYDETQAKRVTDLVESQFGNVESLSEALEKHKELQDWVKESPRNQKAFDIARAVEGLNIAKGQHPSGVFISYHPLDGHIPTELTKTGDTVTAYDMNVVATLGLKGDYLGLRTLDVISQACKQAGIRSESIDVNHQSIYDYYARTDLFNGLFQISEGLTKQVVTRIKPRNINELAACIAISRPGALQYITQYQEYLHNGILKPIHPLLDEVLKPTGGIILYQEQINEVCMKVFGMTAVDADQVRYYVGKKLKDEMKKIEPILYEKGRAVGLPDEITKYFWDVCDASADYLFNASHAYAYSYIAAITTYLKANYPKQFTFALLKLSKHEPNSQTVLTAIIAESKQLGIAILPPDIMKSQEDFAIEENGVRFGLSHIRGISDTTMAKLVSFRREHATKFDIFGAAQEAKISIAVLTGLIMCGALDTRGVSRAKVTLEAQTYNLLTPREVLLVNQLGAQYDYDLLAIIKALSTKTDEKGKPFIKESRLATLRRDFAPYDAMFAENSKNEQLCCLLAERHYLGFSYSATLREVFGKKVEGLQPISEVVTEVGNAQVRFAAFIDEVKSAVGLKSGKPYVRFDMSDETGSLKVMISGEDSIEAVKQFHGGIPGEGELIIVSGHKAQDGDTVFVSMGGRFKQQRGESFVRQNMPFLIKKSGLVVEI